MPIEIRRENGWSLAEYAAIATAFEVREAIGPVTTGPPRTIMADGLGVPIAGETNRSSSPGIQLTKVTADKHLYAAKQFSYRGQTLRIRSGLRAVTAGAAFVVLISEGGVSQSPSTTGQMALNDISITLTSGTVVRIRNLVVFQSPELKGTLTVYIQTPTPSTEQQRLASEAKEIAALQIKSPALGNLTTVSVAVCRTIACVEMSEKPEELFVFVRKPDGSLEAEKTPSPVEVDTNSSLMRITNLFVGEWKEPVCGSSPPEGEFIWFTGGDFCEWVSPTRGRVVAQRDEQRRVHAVILNRQTKNEADAQQILDSLATGLRSFGLSERGCEPGSSPAGAIRSWLYEDRAGIIVHILRDHASG